MKTFRIDQNKLGIKNFDRLDECLIFNRILERFRCESAIEIGKGKALPYMDVVECTIDGTKFELFRDLNYGTGVTCNNPECLEKIEEILND